MDVLSDIEVRSQSVRDKREHFYTFGDDQKAARSQAVSLCEVSRSAAWDVACIQLFSPDPAEHRELIERLQEALVRGAALTSERYRENIVDRWLDLNDLKQGVSIKEVEGAELHRTLSRFKVALHFARREFARESSSQVDAQSGYKELKALTEDLHQHTYRQAQFYNQNTKMAGFFRRSSDRLACLAHKTGSARPKSEMKAFAARKFKEILLDLTVAAQSVLAFDFDKDSPRAGLDNNSVSWRDELVYSAGTFSAFRLPRWAAPDLGSLELLSSQTRFGADNISCPNVQVHVSSRSNRSERQICGDSEMEHSGQGSPILRADIPGAEPPFFFEQGKDDVDAEEIDAIRSEIKREFPGKTVAFIISMDEKTSVFGREIIAVGDDLEEVEEMVKLKGLVGAMGEMKPEIRVQFGRPIPVTVKPIPFKPSPS